MPHLRRSDEVDEAHPMEVVDLDAFREAQRKKIHDIYAEARKKHPSYEQPEEPHDNPKR